jgi:YVTN family beta-propeller protein
VPLDAAVTPDGSRLLVVHSGFDLGGGFFDPGKVIVVNTATNTRLGLPITVGREARAIAITPDGTRAYVLNAQDRTVSVIDIATQQVVGMPIPVGVGFPRDIAISPDGSRAYVPLGGGDGITVIDTASNQVVATVPAGSNHHGIVAAPNQGPSAAFTASAGPPGSATGFDAGASSDSDGTVAAYTWDFGDGSSETGASPATSHVYAQPGTYTVRLTVTDNEGCSSTRVFTGQTVSCNGGGAATAEQSVTVADTDPADLKLAGKKRQKADAALELKASCDEPCTLSAGGKITVGGGGGKSAVKAFRLGKARASIGAGQRKTLKLKVPKAARGARSGTARITVTATDAAGNKSRAKRTIKITR